jgi:hypothetical protein
MKLVSAQFLSLCLFAAAAPARAGVSLGASPAYLDIELTPGKTSAQTVLLFNQGKDPVEVRAYAWDWWHDETETKKFAPPGTLPHSAASWVTFVPDKVIINPGKAVNVTVTIATPADATGGNYAVAWFEATPDARKGKKELRVGARLGVLIMTGVRGKSNAQITVDELAIEPPSATRPFKAEVRLRNTGNVHLFPKGTLVLLDKDNKLVGHAGFEKRRVLPEAKDSATIKWGGELAPGTYQAVLTVDYGDAGATVKASSFAVPSVVSDRSGQQ